MPDITGPFTAENKFEEIKAMYNAKRALLKEGEEVRLGVLSGAMLLSVNKVTLTEYSLYRYNLTFQVKYSHDKWKYAFDFCPDAVDYHLAIGSKNEYDEYLSTPVVEFESIPYKSPENQIKVLLNGTSFGLFKVADCYDSDAITCELRHRGVIDTNDVIKTIFVPGKFINYVRKNND